MCYTLIYTRYPCGHQLWTTERKDFCLAGDRLDKGKTNTKQHLSHCAEIGMYREDHVDEDCMEECPPCYSWLESCSVPDVTPEAHAARLAGRDDDIAQRIHWYQKSALKKAEEIRASREKAANMPSEKIAELTGFMTAEIRRLLDVNIMTGTALTEVLSNVVALPEVFDRAGLVRVVGKAASYRGVIPIKLTVLKDLEQIAKGEGLDGALFDGYTARVWYRRDGKDPGWIE